MAGDALSLGFERGRELVPALKTHRESQAQATRFIDRQRMGLGIVHHLQAVLDAPQECVGLLQLADGLRRQEFCSRKPGQGGQQGGRLQHGLRAASDELLRLDDELDFPDAAGAELDVAESSRRSTSRAIIAFMSRRLS